MAASGCLDEERSEALAEHSAVRKKSVLFDMMLPERIYQRTEFDFVRSGPPSGGASGGKCLVERLGASVLNKVVGSGVSSSSSSPALGLVGSRDGYQPPSEFTAERRNHRYDRAASTDSVATSSGESCRSSSDSASSAPCSPESVLSDSGGAEGLPDSVASLVSGDLGDLVDATPDSGFNLSRLLLPQQHRQGESASDARKRDLRLVDEVVAAATAAASDSCCPAASMPASPRPQSSALAATTALSFSSALASSLSSSSSATAAVTSSTTCATPFLTTCSTSTVAASLLVPPASVSSSVTSSSVSSVPVSSSSCSGPVVSRAELRAGVPAPACRQALPLTSPKCVAPVASPAPHPGGCAKSRRKRKLSGDARKQDGTAVSDEEPEDEDICRRREAEVESLLRHCVDLVAERLDPRRSTTSSTASISTSTTASSSISESPLRNHREHQPELRRRHESHHQATTASPSNSHRHRQQRESRHQERHAQEDCEEASRSQERRNHVLEHRTGHHQHHSLPNFTSQPNHNSQQQQQNHNKQHHLRQAALEAPLPPPSPDCSSSSSCSRSIPDEEESGCLLETETTPNAGTSAPTLSRAVSPTTAPPRAASPTIGSSTGVSPAKASSTTAAGPSTSSAAAPSSSTPCASSSSSFAAAPSPCSSTQSSVVAGEDGLFSCRWLECEMRLRSEEALGDHVRAAHVDTQTRDQGIYACRWQGCKVFERRSCSRQWLERHVTLSHCGSRPFPCIVAGCGQRFGSQGALQRHVNAHFERSLNGSGPVPVGGGPGSSGAGNGLASGGSLLGTRGFGSKELANGESPLKLLRLRKKLKCRRRAWATAKHADFFDAGVMEELKHRLADISAPQSPTEPHSWNGSTVTFHGTVVARRKENTGKVKVLLHWVPEHVLPDSWVFENQSTEKVVALSSLSAEDLHTLNLWPKDLPSPCQESPCQGSPSGGGRRRKRK